jgi:uncharacterized protein YdeI (YjbR/CyaY-like superfamily)
VLSVEQAVSSFKLCRMTDDNSDVQFFSKSAEWRTWLAHNHANRTELWVGFHKTTSGQDSITWPQSVDEALCYGWIDGQRKSIDDTSYKIRFTPRKKDGVWSAANVKRVGELTELGLMQPAGRKAFEERAEAKTGLYPYEKEYNDLPPEYEKRFRANKKAWAYFDAQPPSYRKLCIWWVVSAKKEETREKRMATLIEDSEQGIKSATFKRAGGGSWSDAPSKRPK